MSCVTSLMCAIAEDMQRVCSDLLRSFYICLTAGSRLEFAAFEPHSALPLAMPGVFCEYSGLLPPALKGIRVLASSSVGAVPVTGFNHSDMAHALQHIMYATASQTNELGTMLCAIACRYSLCRVCGMHGTGLGCGRCRESP